MIDATRFYLVSAIRSSALRGVLISAAFAAGFAALCVLATLAPRQHGCETIAGAFIIKC